MSTLDLNSMRSYLSRSIASSNQNKINGLLAEVDFRRHLNAIGLGGNVAGGGWIARSSDEPANFAKHALVMFPETVAPLVDLPSTRTLPAPPAALTSVGYHFQSIGIDAAFCAATVAQQDDTAAITWHCQPLKQPSSSGYLSLAALATGFKARSRRYNFLRYNADVSSIPANEIPEEFSKEHLRVYFQDRYMSELVDIDGVFWSQRFAYPIEIKEKTAGDSKKMGPFFGLDVGPFVKLAFYAAQQGSMRALFVVREIADTSSRELVQWWFLPFDEVARVAGWTPLAGGRSMRGSASSTVPIPKHAFHPLTATALRNLP